MNPMYLLGWLRTRIQALPFGVIADHYRDEYTLQEVRAALKQLVDEGHVERIGQRWPAPLIYQARQAQSVT